MARERLDLLLVSRGLAESRSRAQALIRAGLVTVGGQIWDKPGMQVPVDADLAVRETLQYVGRGGLKLQAALDAYHVDPTGLACLDVGASTGGFTDVLLRRGARRVYAVDVGRGQLAWRLRQDPRVVSMERTDIRAVASLPEPIDLATMDVSFISVTRVLPAARKLMSSSALAIVLVKPQFEAGPELVGRGGVVRDPEVHRAVLAEILRWADKHGWHVAGALPSPVRGGDGNREFLLALTMPECKRPGLDPDEALSRALAEPV